MTFWISKYALTKGIFSVEHPAVRGGGYLGVEGVGFFCPSEWHDSREAALAKAESMRLKKIASIEKQLAKLKAMNFIPDEVTP